MYGHHLRNSISRYEYIGEITDEKPIFSFTDGSSYPIRVRFVGDIDNDGVDDYIIWSGMIYDMHSVNLFLSSDRRQGIYQQSAYSYLDFD